MAEADSVLGTYLGISYQSPEDKVLRLLIELGAQFVGAQEGSLLVLDEEKQELVFAMTVGPEASQAALVGQRVPLGKGITGLAAQTHEVQIGAPTFGTQQAAEHQGGPQAVIAAPMLIADRLIGVITAVSFQPDKRFTHADGMLYARIATVAGVVVEQRRKLSAVEAMDAGGRLPKPITQDERLEREILDGVKRLVKGRPNTKARIARLLADLGDLLAE